MIILTWCRCYWCCWYCRCCCHSSSRWWWLRWWWWWWCWWWGWWWWWWWIVCSCISRHLDAYIYRHALMNVAEHEFITCSNTPPPPPPPPPHTHTLYLQILSYICVTNLATIHTFSNMCECVKKNNAAYQYTPMPITNFFLYKPGCFLC